MAGSNIEQTIQNPPAAASGPDVSRRGFLTKGVAALAGASALAAAISPLRDLQSDDIPTIDEFLQKHYKEMTPDDKLRVFTRIRTAVEKRYHVSVKLTDPPPMDGVEFVYGLNLSRCIGCRRCVHACVKENNQSRSPEIQYIRVLEMEKGSIDVDSSDHHYDRAWFPTRTSTTCRCSATSVRSRRA